TYYQPNGGLGACGEPLQNSDFIVALGAGHYNEGSHCGQTISVECTKLIQLRAARLMVGGMFS
ncbi:hypothetical protein B0H11DRAFT_1733636, partial [Mycena galericulata]